MLSWLIDKILMVFLGALFIMPIIFIVGLVWIVVLEFRDK